MSRDVQEIVNWLGLGVLVAFGVAFWVGLVWFVMWTMKG